MKEFQVQIAWQPQGENAGQVEIQPKKEEANKHFLISNDASAIRSLFQGSSLHGWFVIDAFELHRILFPELPIISSDTAPFKSPKDLLKLWQQCNSRLDGLPVWVHHLCSSLLYSIEEFDLSSLFSCWAESLKTSPTDHDWKQSFDATVKRVERGALPDLTDCTPLQPDLVATYLEEGGALSRLVDGYEPRPGQIKMLKAVTQSISQGHHLVVEAGTGTGKSLAYLLPAALWAKLNDVPVVISTNTKNLQTQLVEKDLPAVLRMLKEAKAFPGMPELRAAVIKGRSNYLCLRRLGQLINGGQYDLQRPETRMMIGTLIWAPRSVDGDLDALIGSGTIDKNFIHLLTSGSDECSGRACPFFHRCFLQKAREKSLRANLIIANHSLVFAELSADAPVSIPAYAQIIFDEAHNLEEAATNFFTKELSSVAVSSMISRIAQRRGKKSRGVLFSVQSRLISGAISVADKEAFQKTLDLAFDETHLLEGTSTALFRAMHPLLATNETAMRYKFAPVAPDEPPPAPNDKWKAVRNAEKAFTGNLTRLEKVLENLVAQMQGPNDGTLNLAVSEISDLGAAISRVREMIETTQTVLSGADESYVFWMQGTRTPGALAEACASPLNVGEFMANHLYGRKSSVIFCSATLSVGKSFRYIESRLGLNLIPQDRLDVCLAESPFDYRRQSSLVVPMYLPEPTSQDRSYVTELSNLVLQLAMHYHGRTLVLFTSYEMMKQSSELIRTALEERGIALLVQGKDGSRNLITKVFRENGGSVLFGTQSFWEGVDVVGEALSCVVVARLPFVSPAEPVNAARCEQIDKDGGHSFFDLSVPMAVVRLKQGFGRLIRHRLDHGTVVIADTRIITKGYGKIFRGSLPVEVHSCRSSDEVMDALR